ncbi:MAG: hypothetical protein GX442_18685 [Candidatus Riflebacteria bacterium]|nr:hypothetical protein [Candidatus Riflebacteria bacterium]
MNPPAQAGCPPLGFFTPYSFGEGVCPPARMAAALAAAGQTVLPMTDVMGYWALVPALRAAAAHGLHPLFGLYAPLDEGFLLLYPDDEAGFIALSRAASAYHRQAAPPAGRLPAWLHGLAGRGRIVAVGAASLETLADLSASGWKPFWGVGPDCSRARAEEEARLAGRLAAPPVAVALLRFAAPGDRFVLRILRAIHQNALADRVAAPQAPIALDPASLARPFAWFPEAVAGAAAFAATPTWAPGLGTFHLPRLHDDPDASLRQLRELARRGIRDRFGTPPAPVEARLEEELAVIAALGFADYFLLVHEIVVAAEARGHRVLGRGSAANSLVSYALRFTHVDPLRHNLYFERFLNPGRTSPPDIDLDFSWRIRDEIYEFLRRRWGDDQVALISTHVTLGGRGALRETGKALGFPGPDLGRFSRAIGHLSVADFLAQAADLPRARGLPLDNPAFRRWLKVAERLEGIPTHLSLHAGGVVVAPGGIHRFTPVQPSSKPVPMTQLEMHGIEAVGLVKIDLLAQRSLGVFADVLQGITPPAPVRTETPATPGTDPAASPSRPSPLPTTPGASPEPPGAVPAPCQPRQAPADLAPTPHGGRSPSSPTGLPANNGTSPKSAGGPHPGATEPPPLTVLPPLPPDFADVDALAADPPVAKALAEGRTMGVFYIESPGMRSLLAKLRCRGFGELTAASSVIRPGVAESGMMQAYIARHRDPRRRVAVHPLLDEVLRETYGVMIYQEDVMKVAHALAGFTLGEADLLRRAMSGKERGSEIMVRNRARFLDGAAARGVAPPIAEEIWRQMESFSGYAFCKAHSASYAVLSLQLLWMKMHHPARFMAGVLDNRGGFYGPQAYLSEARRLGVTVLPPDVIDSGWDCTVSGQTIRLGLSFVKGLGRACHDRLVAERARAPFDGLADFLGRVRPDEGEFTALNGSGALARFGPPAACQMARIFDGAAGLFPREFSFPAFAARQPSAAERARLELAAMGLMVSAHPLDLVETPAGVTTSNRLAAGAGKVVRMAGFLIASKPVTTKRGDRMRFLTLEDREGPFEVTVFPPAWRRFGAVLNDAGCVFVEGRVDADWEVPSLNASRLAPLRPRREPDGSPAPTARKNSA